jgi:iron(III) transport system ATP-binding protein
MSADSKLQENGAVAHPANGLILKDITHRYGRHQPTLQGLNLCIQHGSSVAILGPSGCGKSTLLRIIAGLEPHSGEISFMGSELLLKTHPPEKRNFGMVFQDPALFPHLTVAKNIEFGLKGVPAEERKARILKLTKMLKIEPYLKRYPHQISGGQKQRAAIVRAMVRQPQLMLLDEPFSSLDAKLRMELVDEIKEVLMGTTTIMVTHDQSEAFRMADHIVVMNEGQIMQQGSPKELHDHPQNLFVAQFVGDGCLAKDHWFVRPEWLTLRPEMGAFHAKVQSVSDHGHGFFHQLQMESGETLPWYHHEALGLGQTIQLDLTRDAVAMSN